MKKIIFILTFIPINIFAQYSCWLFENNYTEYSNLHICNDLNNIWQIGQPQKTYLNSSYSGHLAIITDTLNNYPINNQSSFQIALTNPYSYPSNFSGVPWIEFYHKYDFENKHDGGFIEISWDNGQHWNNIVLDSIANNNNGSFCSVYNGLYSTSDTINGGIPAFTGNSNGWIFSTFICDGLFYDFPIDSILLRFTFISDSNNTANEGWLIDNLCVNITVCENVNFERNFDFVSIFPNPANDRLNIEIKENAKLEILNLQGQLIDSKKLTENSNSIDLTNLISGVYTLRISNDRGILIRKLIKQ